MSKEVSPTIHGDYIMAQEEITRIMYDARLTPENVDIVVSKIKPIVVDMITKKIKEETDEEMRNHPEFGDLHKLLYPMALPIEKFKYSKWETIPYYILKSFGIKTNIINEELHEKSKKN